MLVTRVCADNGEIACISLVCVRGDMRLTSQISGKRDKYNFLHNNSQGQILLYIFLIHLICVTCDLVVVISLTQTQVTLVRVALSQTKRGDELKLLLRNPLLVFKVKFSSIDFHIRDNQYTHR